MKVNILPEVTSSVVLVDNLLYVKVLDLGLTRVGDSGNSEEVYIWSRTSTVSVSFLYFS